MELKLTIIFIVVVCSWISQVLMMRRVIKAFEPIRMSNTTLAIRLARLDSEINRHIIDNNLHSDRKYKFEDGKFIVVEGDE